MEMYFNACSAGGENSASSAKPDNNKCSVDERLPDFETIPCYSELEVQNLTEKLNNDESFKEAQLVLITWLKRGECNKNNSESFFSLIKLCLGKLKILQMEKKECQERVEIAEVNLANKIDLIQCDLTQIENAFKVIAKPGVLDNFTQFERNKIQLMKEDIFDFKKENLKNIGEKKSTDSKRFSNELLLLKQQLEDLNSKLAASRKEEADLKAKCDAMKNEHSVLKSDLDRMKRHSENSSTFDFQFEGKLNCFITGILFEHYPNGLSLDYIHDFLNDNNINLTAAEIDSFMKRLPHIFQEICCGEEKKWFYTAFER